MRSRARWTAERCSPAARRAPSGSPPGSRGGRRRSSRTTYGCSGIRPSASSTAIASSWRPAAATARWRFADSALRTRLSSPRSARDTWRASSSRSAPAAPIRRRNVPTASPLFQVTTPRPRRSRQDAGSPTSREPRREDRGLVRRQHELEVGPAAGQAQRAAGQEAATQPGGPAMLGGGRPVERGTACAVSLVRRSRTASRATAGSRAPTSAPRPADSAMRSHGRAGSIAASSLRRAVTRSRSERVTVRPSDRRSGGGSRSPPRARA